MWSENVKSVPHLRLPSGLGVCFPVEVSEGYKESAKLLQFLALSHCAGFSAGKPVFSSEQYFNVLHGRRGIWSPPGCFSNYSPQEVESPFKSGFFLGGSDKLVPTTYLDADRYSPRKKLAQNLSHSNHRPSRDLINTLPDELLCHIFQFLGLPRDRVASASVSKKWLMLQSHMPRESFMKEEDEMGQVDSGNIIQIGSNCAESDGDFKHDYENGTQHERWEGDLSRCLSGRKASDVRLAAIALGTESRGGLGKLCIRGGSAAGLKVGLTDVGLSAIGGWCSGLRVLSLWTCHCITDEGLSAIGKGCHLLEKVDLSKCPLLGDSGLQSIAKNCPQLSFLSLDDCEQVGDNAIGAVSEHCPKLMTLNIQNCPRISDQGIISAVCRLGRLKKMKLAGLRLTDKCLAAIGLHARALFCLTLQNLDSLSAEGFAEFSMAGGLQSLKRLVISSCRNFTDLALGPQGKNCTFLKQISLCMCDQVTDEGLSYFTSCASALQVLRLEKCNSITGTGLIAALSGRVGAVGGGGSMLREVEIKKCEGIRKVQPFSSFNPSARSVIRSFCLSECPGVSDLFLALVGLLCPEVTTLELSGLTDITDDALLALICGRQKLTSVKISGCLKVTDRAVCAVARQGGESLKTLVLDGCTNVSEKSLEVISNHCVFLEDLDISECTVSYDGLKALVDSTGQTLSSLNLSGCVGITDKILPLIHENCDSLLDLNLKNCSGLSERAITAIQSRMWNCTVLY